LFSRDPQPAIEIFVTFGAARENILAQDGPQFYAYTRNKGCLPVLQ
jgi:hypothetical protein